MLYLISLTVIHVFLLTVTPKPADNYTKVFIVVGAFLVTTLVAVIVFATLRPDMII
jgi:hypothetical protein